MNYKMMLSLIVLSGQIILSGPVDNQINHRVAASQGHQKQDKKHRAGRVKKYAPHDVSYTEIVQECIGCSKDCICTCCACNPVFWSWVGWLMLAPGHSAMIAERPRSSESMA